MRTLGIHLSERLQRQCKAMFINRYTKDHKPTWVTTEPVQFASDDDWLANTYFEITKKGELSRRCNYCESYPTWPDGKEGNIQ